MQESEPVNKGFFGTIVGFLKKKDQSPSETEGAASKPEAAISKTQETTASQSGSVQAPADQNPELIAAIMAAIAASK